MENNYAPLIAKEILHPGMRFFRKAFRTHQIYITCCFYLFVHTGASRGERKEASFIFCLHIFDQKMMSSHYIINFIA